MILHPNITCGLCRACRSGDDVHCANKVFPGIDSDGGYAEFLKTSARSVVKIDDALEPSDVAALADAGLTAYHAAAKAARRLRPVDRVVVIGAGGLGHIGIQVLAAMTAAEIVVVVDRNPDAVALAESIGAHHGVVADGSHVEHVLDLTGGHGAEVVVDFVGEGGSTAQGLKMLREAGDYHVVGYGENIDVPTIDIISTEINIVGNLVGSYNDLTELMALAARGLVTLHTVKYALDDFQTAVDDLDGGRVGAGRSSSPDLPPPSGGGIVDATARPASGRVDEPATEGHVRGSGGGQVGVGGSGSKGNTGPPRFRCPSRSRSWSTPPGVRARRQSAARANRSGSR